MPPLHAAPRAAADRWRRPVLGGAGDDGRRGHGGAGAVLCHSLHPQVSGMCVAFHAQAGRAPPADEASALAAADRLPCPPPAPRSMPPDVKLTPIDRNIGQNCVTDEVGAGWPWRPSRSTAPARARWCHRRLPPIPQPGPLPFCFFLFPAVHLRVHPQRADGLDAAGWVQGGRGPAAAAGPHPPAFSGAGHSGACPHTRRPLHPPNLQAWRPRAGGCGCRLW